MSWRQSAMEDYVGVYLWDATDDQAEIDIAGRVCRMSRAELRPVGPWEATPLRSATSPENHDAGSRVLPMRAS